MIMDIGEGGSIYIQKINLLSIIHDTSILFLFLKAYPRRSTAIHWHIYQLLIDIMTFLKSYIIIPILTIKSIKSRNGSISCLSKSSNSFPKDIKCAKKLFQCASKDK